MVMKFPKHPDLAKEVRAYLKANNMPQTTFGIEAMNDSALIFDLIKGRELRSGSLKRIRQYMKKATKKGTAK